MNTRATTATVLLAALIVLAPGCSSSSDRGDEADVSASSDVAAIADAGADAAPAEPDADAAVEPDPVADTESGDPADGAATTTPDAPPAVGDAEPAAPGADMVLMNGRIFTANANDTFVNAIAVTGGAVVWKGINDAASNWIGSNTVVVDLGGRLVLPGLHDVHQHPLEAQLDVIDCILDPMEWDPEDYVDDLVGCAATDETGWVLGWGFSVLTVVWAQRPPREILDEVFPDTPVAIMEETSHSTLVNSAALAALVIDMHTPNPPGGLIIKDESGQPNGLLVDSAGEWPWDTALAPTPALEAGNDAALLAGQALNSQHGITSAVDARVYLGRGHLEAYQKAAAADALTVRMVLALWAYADADDTEQIAELSALFDDSGGMLRTRQIKVYSDGLTQNTTAALLEPYVTETWGPLLGLNYFDEARLASYTGALQAVGFDMHIHAIGDRAVREALNAIEATKDDFGGGTARHRLTHVELVHPDDVPRFAALGVHADMQLAEWTLPDALHDMDEFIGAERVDERAWPAKDIHDTGAVLALSSDYDVGSLSPFDGMEIALTRGEQSLPDVTAAVRAYTINAARIMGSESWTGSLEVGKRADFVVLDQDIFVVLPHKIGATKVLWTVLDGEEVYRAPGYEP